MRCGAGWMPAKITKIFITDVRLLMFGGGITTHSTHHPFASISRTLWAGQAQDWGSSRLQRPEYSGSLIPGRDASTSWRPYCHRLGRRTTNYAYEAIKYLYKDWDLMRISWLKLCLPSRAISSIDDPRLWNLLKIYNLRHLTILGLYSKASNVCEYLKMYTYNKKLIL